MSYCFKTTILAEIWQKCVIFIKKLQKSPRAGGSAPRPPRLRKLGPAPQTPGFGIDSHKFLMSSSTYMPSLNYRGTCHLRHQYINLWQFWRNCHIALLLFDLKKAFDTVDHVR